MADKIDWSIWETKQFVRLTAGRTKVLTFDSVRQSTTFVYKRDATGAVIDGKRVPCLDFHVVKEDDAPVNKTFSVTSKTLVNKLRLLIKRGFPFTVRITSYGERHEREYEVEAV